MSDSTSTAVPTQATGPDDGWCLEKQSWPFHRSAFRILGRPLPYAEYSHLRRQIAAGEAELLRFGDEGGVYRTRLRDGAELDVLARTVRGKKLWHTLIRAMRPGGKPRAVASPAPVTVAPPLPPARAPELAPVQAPPPPIRRASTLTLAAPNAAEALAARLRPKTPPPRLDREPVQKLAQRRW